jgi:hypothetical protein
MLCNAKNYWVFEFFPLSDILKSTILQFFRNAGRWMKSRNSAVILRIINIGWQTRKCYKKLF